MTIMVEVDGKFYPLPKVDAPPAGGGQMTPVYEVSIIEPDLTIEQMDEYVDGDEADDHTVKIYRNSLSLRQYVVVVDNLFFNSHDFLIDAMRDVRLILRFVCYLKHSYKVGIATPEARAISAKLRVINHCPIKRAARYDQLSKRFKT